MAKPKKRKTGPTPSYLMATSKWTKEKAYKILELRAEGVRTYRDIAQQVVADGLGALHYPEIKMWRDDHNKRIVLFGEELTFDEAFRAMDAAGRHDLIEGVFEPAVTPENSKAMQIVLNRTVAYLNMTALKEDADEGVAIYFGPLKNPAVRNATS